MKTIAIVVLLCVAAQAHHGGIHADKVISVRRTFPELPGAPKYPTSRIISGTQATHGQFPYQAAVWLDGSAFCGGSLISSRWVLTAGHCGHGIKTFTVYLGAQSVSAAEEDGRVIITTTDKIVHPNYNSLFIWNDVTLLNLGQDVALTDFIKPITLAKGSNTFEGAAVRVSGWGKTSDASNSVSSELNFADLSIISNTQCRKSYSFLLIRSSTICAIGSGSTSTCNGDSGGPLVDQASGKQIGVVSFVSGLGCESGSPSGYARVTSFAEWIEENTGITI